MTRKPKRRWSIGDMLILIGAVIDDAVAAGRVEHAKMARRLVVETFGPDALVAIDKATATNTAARVRVLERALKTTRKPKRKSNNPAGRPSSGLSESLIQLRVPELVRQMAVVAAGREDVDLSEFVRRALRVRLGLLEVPQKPEE